MSGCFDSLGEFISALEAAGELVRIRHPVSARLEVTEIADRVMKQPGGGKALLFENVLRHDGTRSPYPLAINLFGSKRRMAMALGVQDLDEVGARIASMLELKVPEGFLAKLALLPRLLEVAKFPPRRFTGAPPCQEIVWRGREVDVMRLPVITCWPGDAGPYITLPMVVSRDPVRGTRNVGMYRVQVLGPDSLAMHWQRHKGGAEHQRVAQDIGAEKIPVAVSLGGDPAIIWAGSAPLPNDIDEMMLAGWLRGKSVELVRCVTQPIEVPADAEIVIEGYVNPREQKLEGPFGDHTGYYSNADYYPVMHVTAITHRRDAIYPATIVGKPPMEDAWMGKATERLFLPLIKMFQSEVVDINLPIEGAFHNLAIVSIKKRYPVNRAK